MPTYDYICNNCEHKFEQFQAITANPLRKCVKCGKMSLKRLIGIGSGVIFKGSGFYQTDYRSDSYKQAEKNDKPSTETKSKAETKSKDKKPTKKAKSTNP